MSLELSTLQQQKQTLKLSLQQRQSLQILAMPAPELREYINGELENNPVLEPDEGYVLMQPERTGADDHPPEPYESHRGRQSDRTLQQELLFLLMTGHVNAPVALCEYLIACLDENGYLRLSTAELSASTGQSEQAIEAAIAELQRLEPTGVFARSLSECLLLQLRAREVRMPLAERICADYLEEVARGNLLRLAKCLDSSVQEVSQAVALIKSLDPRPGGVFFSGSPRYILPDIKVAVRGDGLEVTSLMGLSVYINPYYTDRLGLVDELTRGYLSEKITSGKRLIDCLEQRRRTLLMVARAAVDYQSGFFLRDEPIAPLTMLELASLLGVHESTVSRTVKDKYLSYSGGTMPLAKLFCGSLSGGGSPLQAKRLIAKLVEDEDKAAPLSDEKLTVLLAQRGITLSRRAAAKYRDELGLPSSQSRRW